MVEAVGVYVSRLASSIGIELPTYATEGAAGLDLQASLHSPYTLLPGEHKLVPTGLFMAIPLGYEGQVRPRSGLALKHKITVLNAPGTIDADYRGEVGVLLINHSGSSYIIRPGDRIAQLVIAPVSRLTLSPVSDINDLSLTARGAGGFGSTSS